MAHVMKPGPNIPGPFSNTTYITTATHGWVPANSWFAAAPFNSAPPPVPAGVNPQLWMNGQWQPNPMFRPQPGMNQGSVQMWAPHPGWAAAVGQGQNQNQGNPFKRIPNPGDASYWATKLSDNPLGLENMHIRDDTPANERHFMDQSNGVPHTPWVWVPKELGKEPSKSAQSNAASGPQGGQAQSRQAEKALPPPPHSQPPRDHIRTNSSSRNVYGGSAPTHDTSSQSRKEEPVIPPLPPSMSSSSAFWQHQQQQQRQQETQRTSDRQQAPTPHPSSQHSSSQYSSTQHQQSNASQHHSRQRSRDVSPRPTGGESQSQSYPSQHNYRSHTTSSASSSASAAAAATAAVRSATAPARDRDLDRSDNSTPREMHLTFSPKIIRTPDHYSSPPSRRTSHDDTEHTPSRTPSHGNIYAPASNTPSRSNSMSRPRRQSSTSTPSSASTSTSTTPTGSSSLGLLTFTEEPQALLSPLVVGGTPPGSSTKPSPGREISRSQTYPAVYTIPEEREHKVYPRTPNLYDRARSRDRDLDRERERERERDRERDRERERERERDVNSTPQPPTRTPPSRTPPSSHYTRPSPESGSHSRQISRSWTYPAAAPVANSPPSTSPHYGTSPHSHAQQQYSSSSNYSSSSYSRTSPNANPARSRGTSPLRHNPLPRPPAVSPYTESLARGSSSASAAAAVHQQQQSSYAKRVVRAGYWNRRGDHLYVTDKGERFIVYAPHHLANPEELKTYPSPTEGWRDHRGDFIKYDGSVPELLDSLPLQGRSPLRPYSSFVHLIEF